MILKDIEGDPAHRLFERHSMVISVHPHLYEYDRTIKEVS